MKIHPGSILLLGVLAAAGCTPKQAPTKADFNATDTPGRVPAIVNAAEQDDPQTLAHLVRALSDDDPAVRLFAIQSLRERTGQSFGYRYYEPDGKRQAAAARWAAWLNDRPDPDAGATAEVNP